MVPTKAWLNTLLTGSSALVALLGSVAHIVDTHPSAITLFPMVCLTDDNHADMEYADNKPLMDSVSIKIDVYTKIDGALPTTTAIAQIIIGLLADKFFSCGQNGEVPDPTDGVRHRVLKFSRELLPSDLL
jgi:hypothetical protein